MTGTREPQQEGRIQAMLLDAGLDSSAELRRSLDELGALVPDRAPEPRADLAALLAAGSFGSPAAGASLPDGVSSLTERRRGSKRRLAVVGGAVIGAMTLGAGAVAASSEDFRRSVGQTVRVMFQPAGGTTTPQPARPSPSDVPSAWVPVPAGTGPAGPALEGPGPTVASPAAPAPGGTPPAAGRDGVLPMPPHRPVTPGMPAIPGLGDGRSLPSKPLPAPTFPGAEPPGVPGPGGLPGDG